MEELTRGVFRNIPFEGNSQYRGGLCYELSGQNFHLVMDDGHDYLIQFVSGETLMWSQDSGSFRWESYECLKVDEETYFVNLELKNMPYRYSIALILDTAQSLVTISIANQGHHPKLPEMINTRFIFGAIKIDGQPLPKKRHGYTNDMTGKRIFWRYSPIFAITHVYYNPFYYRISRLDSPEWERRPKPTPEQLAEMQEWPTDEPSTYIKIKDNIYLFSFIEDSYIRKRGRGYNLQICMDIDRLHDVGKSFGINPNGPENYLFVAVGQWEESDGSIESQESKYRV
jgi:hypothetical protein